jgi:gluconokinase
MMTTVDPTHAALPLILTIDIGTSSVRVLLFDAEGRVVNTIIAQERYAMRVSADGAAEDDPDAALDRVARCVDTALAQAGPLAACIGGVAVDTLVSNVIGLDAAKRPITPMVIYADTRNDADADHLRAELDERDVHNRTGCLLRTSYWPARLAWYRRTQPRIWGQVAQWITLGEYLELQLFGRCRVSYSAASWSGLLDRRRLIWDDPLLEWLGVRNEQLAPLVDVGEPLRGLLEPYATRWPTLRDVPWFPAIGDGAAANIGSGCAGPSRIALTVGTTGALRVVVPEAPQAPAGLWCYRVDGKRTLLGGATSEGGNVYAWMRDTLRLGPIDNLDQELARLPPDAHRLTILPFLAGERSPGWAGNVQATISGMTLTTTPLEILRAGLESVAYRFALIAEGIRAVSDQQGLLIASGGALLKSPAWLQIIADVLGRPVAVSTEPEATSRGAALLALEALGAIASIDSLPAADGLLYEPQPEHYAVYRAAIERQRRLYHQIITQH